MTEGEFYNGLRRFLEPVQYYKGRSHWGREKERWLLFHRLMNFEDSMEFSGVLRLQSRGKHDEPRPISNSQSVFGRGGRVWEEQQESKQRKPARRGSILFGSQIRHMDTPVCGRDRKNRTMACFRVRQWERWGQVSVMKVEFSAHLV